jgi:hypothetical protein
MQPTVISSWNDLVEETFAGSFSARLERFRSPYAFRGMVADWPVISSLQRLRHDPQTLGFIEKAMFRNFKKYAYADFDARNSDWKWLSLAQHHGLPTRLLDWTFSPFVAMHFATNELDKMDKDGVIWMVNFERVRSYLPGFFRNALSQHYALTFSVEMLEEDDALIDPFVFERTEGAQDPFVMFFEPPSLDPRIINQWGLFSFTNRLDVRLDEWLLERSAHDSDLVRKIIISSAAKWEIRDKLDNMNLTERVLMPGLDGLSTWLKRWYSPKSAHPVAASPGPVQAAPALAPEPAAGTLVGSRAKTRGTAKGTAATAKTKRKATTSAAKSTGRAKGKAKSASRVRRGAARGRRPR